MITSARPDMFIIKNTKLEVQDIFDSAARTAISASQLIFLAWKDLHWPTDKPILF